MKRADKHYVEISDSQLLAWVIENCTILSKQDDEEEMEVSDADDLRNLVRLRTCGAKLLILHPKDCNNLVKLMAGRLLSLAASCGAICRVIPGNEEIWSKEKTEYHAWIELGDSLTGGVCWDSGHDERLNQAGALKDVALDMLEALQAFEEQIETMVNSAAPLSPEPPPLPSPPAAVKATSMKKASTKKTSAATRKRG